MNLQLDDFLRGLRESIERIRTPIDPIAIQGTAVRVFHEFSTVAGSGVVRFDLQSPPSDGYNRVDVSFTVKSRTGPSSVDFIKIYHQPQSDVEVIGNALFDVTTGVPYHSTANTFYTLEIPDRNSTIGIVCTAHPDNDSIIEVNCIFWRQY